MRVYFNGEKKTIADGLSLADFLTQYEINMTGCAIAINHRFIPRSSYTCTVLNAGDKIECVTPMQGG